MPDIYTTIAEVDPAVVRQLADRLEIRAADSQQRAILHAYLSDVAFPDAARVLEVGCGSGAVARALARWPGIGHVVGVDPSSVLLERARELAVDIDNLAFEQADGRDLPYPEGSFDVVVFHTLLCHVIGPERALAEAFRVLSPGGQLVIFDGDYATTTVATGEHDPLQACVEAAVGNLAHDRWLVRRLARLVRDAGFDVRHFRSHGYLQTSEVTYFLSLIELGASVLVASARIGAESAAALRAEAARRVESGTFFGYIAYGSLLAVRPAAAQTA